MTDSWVPHGGAEYAGALRDLLPDGPAWPRRADSYLMRWCAGNALIWGDIDTAAADLLTRESDARAAVALLPDWERNFGLPDPGIAEPLTVAERQITLVAKMTAVGGQSIAFFIATAAALGYAVTITEYSPYTCGISQCGDTRNPAGIFRWQLGPATIRYFWTVNVGAARLSWLRCGEGQCGLDPSCTIGLATDLQSRLTQWQPAHGQVLFNYAALGGAQGPLAGTP